MNTNNELPVELTEVERKYKEFQVLEDIQFKVYQNAEKEWRKAQEETQTASGELWEIRLKYFPPKKFSYEWFRCYHPGIFLAFIIGLALFAGMVVPLMLSLNIISGLFALGLLFTVLLFLWHWMKKLS